MLGASHKSRTIRTQPAPLRVYICVLHKYAPANGVCGRADWHKRAPVASTNAHTTQTRINYYFNRAIYGRRCTSAALNYESAAPGVDAAPGVQRKLQPAAPPCCEPKYAICPARAPDKLHTPRRRQRRGETRALKLLLKVAFHWNRQKKTVKKASSANWTKL